jgi:hypothetical protein
MVQHPKSQLRHRRRARAPHPYRLHSLADFSISDQVNLGGTGGALLEDTEGFAIGAKLRYDEQIGNVVLGVMTDGFYSFADGNGRGLGAGVFESKLHYYGTVRGRLGYAIGRFMPYATAGYAYGELEVSNTLTGVSESETLNGWVYGGGLEFVGTRTSRCTPATGASISTIGPSRCCRRVRTPCRPKWMCSISVS